MNETFLIDTHSHINMIEDLSIDEVLENASVNHVKKSLFRPLQQLTLTRFTICRRNMKMFTAISAFTPKMPKIGVTGLLTKSEFMHSRQKF